MSIRYESKNERDMLVDFWKFERERKIVFFRLEYELQWDETKGILYKANIGIVNSIEKNSLYYYPLKKELYLADDSTVQGIITPAWKNNFLNQITASLPEAQGHSRSLHFLLFCLVEQMRRTTCLGRKGLRIVQ